MVQGGIYNCLTEPRALLGGPEPAEVSRRRRVPSPPLHLPEPPSVDRRTCQSLQRPASPHG
jgi:hypothetical protein